MTSPTTGRLGAVGGTGPNDVWAVGDTVALHYDGTKWSPVTRGIVDINQFFGYSQSNGSFQTGLWVIDPTEVYLGTAFGRIRRGSSLGWEDMAGPFSNTLRRSRERRSPASHAAVRWPLPTDRRRPAAPMLLRGVGQSGCLNSPMTGTGRVAMMHHG